MINFTHVMRGALAFAGALFVGALSTPAFAQGKMNFPMALVVTDTTGLSIEKGPLYFASNLNSWSANDPAWQLKRVGDTTPAVWELPLKPEQLASGSVEFKITRGSWETVEVNGDGSDVDNHTIGDSSWAMGNSGRLELKVEVAGFADQRGTRWPKAPTADRTPSVTGDLEVFQIGSTVLNNSRSVRVWLPPGYKAKENVDKRYPVLYMNDGQNLFDRATSFAGAEWSVDETVTELIAKGTLEPMIVVGIDNIGDVRANEYNPPYTEWDGKSNYADRYLEFVTKEVMNYVNGTYRTLTGRKNTAFGGSSFGGNVALFAMMTKSDVFGTFLVESPACFISDKAIITKLKEYDGKLPDRVFVAVGTKESSRSGDSDAYINTVKELADVLRSKGLGEDRFKFVVQDGGTHFEKTWADRLPGAMTFLFGQK